MLHSGGHQFKVTLQGATTGVPQQVIGTFRGILIPPGIISGVCTNPSGHPDWRFWGLLAMPNPILMNRWCIRHKKKLQDLYDKHRVDETNILEGYFGYHMGFSTHHPWGEMVEDILNEADLYFVDEIPAELKRKFFGAKKQEE